MVLILTQTSRATTLGYSLAFKNQSNNKKINLKQGPKCSHNCPKSPTTH